MSGGIRQRVSRRRFFKQAGVATLALIGRPEATTSAETNCQTAASRVIQKTSPREKASIDCVVRPAVSSRLTRFSRKDAEPGKRDLL